MQQGVAVGIDVAKDFHWVQALDRRDSEVLFSGRVDTRRPRSPRSSSTSRPCAIAGR
jgi:hypothetical protein